MLAHGTGSLPGAGPSRKPAPSVKQVRKQVSRACEWCRIRRTKCDNGRPCHNCEVRGAACSNSALDGLRSLPQALKEVERLKVRVKDLEAQLNSGSDYGRNAGKPSSEYLPTPPSSLSAIDDILSHSSTSGSTPQVALWEGIYAASARSEQAAYYGPSSCFYFVGRIGAYLSTVLHQPVLGQSIQPRNKSKLLTSPAALGHGQSTGHVEPAMVVGSPKGYMSRRREEYFLSLFWESHHCTLPIIDEGAFRHLYTSLWDGSRTQRKPSPLADIIIAISMQYGFAFLPRDASSASQQDGACEDTTVSGGLYYWRCQSLLVPELDSPSITTLQCQIYSLTYLCCASFQNMAHASIAAAMRTAQTLGLHLEPRQDMPQEQKELRKRIWWVVQTIDSKASMKLGRPFCFQGSQVTVSLPSDSPDAAGLFGSILGSYETDVTWLTYSVQCQKLVDTTRSIYTLLYDTFARVVSQKNLRSPYEDSQALEACAEALSSRAKLLQMWLSQLPAGMKTHRDASGLPFSTSRTNLVIETTAPLWLQRQRIFLELIYHTMCMNLYRPFITFSSNNAAGEVVTYTPISELHTATCVGHAITHIRIMHQVLGEMDVINGWQESFQWQWNASMTVIGFVLAYPISPSTPAARRSLDKAVEVFDMFGASIGAAESAARLVRDLIAKADGLINQFKIGVMTGDSIDREDSEVCLEQGGSRTAVAGDLAQDGSMSEYYSQFMDWALTVDAFNSFEDFYANKAGPDDWWTFDD